jgi:Tfp pilus assembly protein PilF
VLFQPSSLFRRKNPGELYPKSIAPLAPEYIVPAVIAIGITIVCAVLVMRQRIWLAVWSYYIVTLLPVLGILQVGIQSMADRYLPSLAPFLVLGLLASWVSRRVYELRKRRLVVGIVSAAAALFIVASMTYLTFEQMRTWRNSISLWSHVIGIEPEKVPMAYGNRGVAFDKIGDLARALEDYNRAIALDPFYTGIYFERGLVFAKMRQFDRAILDYDKAIELDQYGLKSDVGRQFYFLNRGIAHLEMARSEPAISDFRQACAQGSNRACDILQSLINER